MTNSAVFHDKDLRKKIFEYTKIECLLTKQSIRQKENMSECCKFIKRCECFCDNCKSRRDENWIGCEECDTIYCKWCGKEAFT